MSARALSRQAIIGLGSNLEPRTHLPWAVETLRQAFGDLSLSSIVETAPEGMTDASGAFLNCAMALPTPMDGRALQGLLHELEVQSGRDRSAPDCSTRARTLDLDLLFFIEEGRFDPAALPEEPYMRPLVDELLGFLGIAPAEARAELGARVLLPSDCGWIGAEPRRCSSPPS